MRMEQVHRRKEGRSSKAACEVVEHTMAALLQHTLELLLLQTSCLVGCVQYTLFGWVRTVHVVWLGAYSTRCNLKSCCSKINIHQAMLPLPYMVMCNRSEIKLLI